MTVMPQADDDSYAGEMQKVVELYVQNVNTNSIAKQLGMKRADVVRHIDSWKYIVTNTDHLRDRVGELLVSMDEHYTLLIQKAHAIIEEVDQGEAGSQGRHQYLGQKLGAIKTIAELESKRIDVLQKAGLLDAADLGDELAQMEEQKQILLEILDEELCGECRPKVMIRLQRRLGGGAEA